VLVGDLWCERDAVGPKHHFLAQLLLAVNLGQQEFFPPLGAVRVAGPQLARQTITVPVEQQQWVIAGRLEMPVVGSVLLLAVDRDLSAVHVQHHPLLRIHRFRLGNQVPADRFQTGQVLLLRQRFRFE